jgi:catechol 2,3-dioxygenase-like lactoylglutathione lyase family enzyme
MNTRARLIETTSFSHGTLGLREPERTQRFYKEFLGLHSVRKANGTQYVWLGGEWIIACLPTGKAPREKQGIENRWALQVTTPIEVDLAHEAALAQKELWDIQQVLAVGVDGDVRSFCLQDLDGNWWEIFHRSSHGYDDVFDRGNVAG